jgi:hypothetical protein
VSLNIGSRLLDATDSRATTPGSLMTGPGGVPLPAPATRTGSAARSLMVPILTGLLLVTCCLLPLLVVAALSVGIVSVLLRPSAWAIVIAVASILVAVGMLTYRRQPHPSTAARSGKGS